MWDLNQLRSLNPECHHCLLGHFTNIFPCVPKLRGFPRGLASKEPACKAVDSGDAGSISGSGRSAISWRRKWQPTPVFLPGKSHGQRSLVGCSPWGHRRVRCDLVTKQQQCIHVLCYNFRVQEDYDLQIQATVS